MISEDDFTQKVLRGAVKDAVQTFLRSQDWSAKFLTRSDTRKIDEEIERMTDEITAAFAKTLKDRGYLGKDRTPSEEEFSSLFRSTLDEYLAIYQSDRE